MSQITLSEEAASSLAAAAANSGCSQEELASMLIEDALREDEDFQLTPMQQTRLQESYAQAQRGEFVDGKIVLSRFRTILHDIQAK